MRLLLVIVSLGLAGCGLQARPQPPVVDAAVYGMRVEVVDGKAQVIWRGRPERRYTRFQVQRRDHVIPEGGDPLYGSLLPNLNLVIETEVEPARFHVVGDLPVVRNNPLYAFTDQGLEDGRRYTYRVRPMPVRDRKEQPYRGREVALSWDDPPPPPDDVVLEPVRGGIQLHWKAVPGATGYRVYRVDAADQPSRAHLSLLEVPGFTDLGPGARNVAYVVRSVRLRPGAQPVELEGASSKPARLEAVSELAPPPEGLQMVRGDGEISLSWRQPEGSSDLRFRVYRNEGGRWVRLTEKPLESTSFTDSAPGGASAYRVVSVDAAGREGPPSEPAEVE